MKNKIQLTIIFLLILGVPFFCQTTGTTDTAATATPIAYPTLEPAIWFGVEDRMQTPYP